MRLAGALTWWRPFDRTATMVTKGYAVGRLARSEPDVPPHGRPQVLHGRRRIPARPVNLDISSGVSTDLAQRAPAREGRARGGKIIRLHTPKVTGDGHVPPGQVDRAADRIRCPLRRGQRTPERDRGPDCPRRRHSTAPLTRSRGRPDSPVTCSRQGGRSPSTSSHEQPADLRRSPQLRHEHHGRLRTELSHH